jgi:hypothetical protein
MLTLLDEGSQALVKLMQAALRLKQEGLRDRMENAGFL